MQKKLNIFFLKSMIGLLLTLAASSFAAQSSYDLMERANALYRDGKFKQAITLYHKAESRGADPVATSFNIANSYYQLNDLPNAAATYRKAIDFSNGSFSPALFNMASVYFRLRQYPECVAAYHRALKLEPENVSGWLYLGEAYSKTGDGVGALRAIEKAYQLDKDDISIVYQLSEANIALTASTNSTKKAPGPTARRSVPVPTTLRQCTSWRMSSPKTTSPSWRWMSSTTLCKSSPILAMPPSSSGTSPMTPSSLTAPNPHTNSPPSKGTPNRFSVSRTWPTTPMRKNATMRRFACSVSPRNTSLTTSPCKRTSWNSRRTGRALALPNSAPAWCRFLPSVSLPAWWSFFSLFPKIYLTFCFSRTIYRQKRSLRAQPSTGETLWKR